MLKKISSLNLCDSDKEDDSKDLMAMLSKPLSKPKIVKKSKENSKNEEVNIKNLKKPLKEDKLFNIANKEIFKAPNLPYYKYENL